MSVQYAQKRYAKYVKFVHTYFETCAIIIGVTPPIHYIVFATPHKKKYLLQKSQLPAGFFTVIFLTHADESSQAQVVCVYSGRLQRCGKSNRSKALRTGTGAIRQELLINSHLSAPQTPGL